LAYYPSQLHASEAISLEKGSKNRERRLCPRQRAACNRKYRQVGTMSLAPSTIATGIGSLTIIYLILFVHLLIYLRRFHTGVWVELGGPSPYLIFVINLAGMSRLIQTAVLTSRFLFLDNRYKFLGDNQLSTSVFLIRIVALFLMLLWGLLFASTFLFPGTADKG
jgi:hypothetical protein